MEGGKLISTKMTVITISTEGEPLECDLPRETSNAICTEGNNPVFAIGHDRMQCLNKLGIGGFKPDSFKEPAQKAQTAVHL